ncbi:uncharacterized protein K460DRAFT_410146 [Cucurbitaria berberidis CBS 394.84]|uniref:Uncharacterized protein n=1 Tax=Cucurbitaria berberidis CBS 394.84 TaxID=1168544 RepID=A0A9P4G894_9PLEO|nr:uncharacterized protein K460DRAFT_410146 [Cucurbitaria berberidis CBS 394.84]KAF1840732.1 hypothetical protein K460DRAFT_410146 [Cucurbitaria berberidis CBS 394.84]
MVSKSYITTLPLLLTQHSNINPELDHWINFTSSPFDSLPKYNSIMASISTSSSSLNTDIAAVSPFEHLPAEIRHHIYAYLRFPVGGYMWVDCPGPSEGCVDKSHIIFHEDAKWPMLWHALPREFLIRRKAKQLIFRDGPGKKAGFQDLTVKIIKKDGFVHMKANIENQLMEVNMAIRNELLHLLFDHIDARFEFSLSGQSNLLCQTLAPSTLAHITTITLGNSGIREINPLEKAGPKTLIEHDTTSLLFVVAHCPHIRRLTYATDIHVLKSGTTEQILDFVFACRTLTTSCKELKELQFLALSTLRGGHVVETFAVGGWNHVVVWVWDVLSKVMGGGYLVEA